MIECGRTRGTGNWNWDRSYSTAGLSGTACLTRLGALLQWSLVLLAFQQKVVDRMPIGVGGRGGNLGLWVLLVGTEYSGD